MKIPQSIFLSQLSDNQAWWPSRNNWISTGIWKVLEKTVTCVRWLHFHVINSVCDELDQTIWLLRKFLCNYANKTTLKRGTMLLLLKWNKSWQHCQNTHDAAASGMEISLTSLFRPAAEDCFTSNKEWDAWGSQNEKKRKRKRGRWVKPPFRFFHLKPGNESPDNSHTFGPRNWTKKRAAAVIKVKDGAFLLLILLLEEEQ